MFREDEYLSETFNKIIKSVMKNLIKSSNYEDKCNIDGNIIEEIDNFDLRKGTSTSSYIAGKYLQVDLSRFSLSETIDNIIRDPDYFSDIDFSCEINCFIFVYKIFNFFDNEYDFENIRDGCITFNKDELDSMVILKKKNIIFKILLKCVENFSIDQELKDEAKEMIENTVQYNRAKFLTEEKEEMESLWESLKFRLKNIQEVDYHNVLDELISNDGLPTDDPVKWPFKKEQLIKTKSEIPNIVKRLQTLIFDYSKVNQVNISMKSVKIKKQRQSKVKKSNKRKSKSMKINHVL